MRAIAAIVFPGQGSQRAGMLDAVPSPPAAGELLERVEAATGAPLRDIAATGSPADLAVTTTAQPLLYVADVTWGLALLEAGIVPAGVAGHSLGELAALAVAGVIDPRTGADLVVARSRLMADCAARTPGGMTAVIGLDGAQVAAAIDGIPEVWVANDNAPGQVVLTGARAGLDAAHSALETAGARRLVPLDVAGPFHSPLMAPAGDAFAVLLDEIPFSEAIFPVWQNTGPSPETDGAVIRERLSTQITSPVRWTETMRSMSEAGIRILIEAGPGAVLAGLAKRVEPLRGLTVEQYGIDAILEEVTSS